MYNFGEALYWLFKFALYVLLPLAIIGVIALLVGLGFGISFLVHHLHWVSSTIIMGA